MYKPYFAFLVTCCYVLALFPHSNYETVMSNAFQSMAAQICVVVPAFSLWDIYLVEFLDHVVILLIFILETNIIFHTVTTAF